MSTARTLGYKQFVTAVKELLGHVNGSSRAGSSVERRQRSLLRMSEDTPPLAEGDRVRATRRAGFPHGTVVKILEGGFVLVRWDGDVLETAHPGELTKIEPGSTGR